MSDKDNEEGGGRQVARPGPTAREHELAEAVNITRDIAARVGVAEDDLIHLLESLRFPPGETPHA